MEGVKLLSINLFNDSRGSFGKILSEELASQIHPNFCVAEAYYSYSETGVVRGFHLQKEPSQGFKLIHLIHGAIHDVLLDLRKDSKHFGQFKIFNLKDSESNLLIVPPGVAHGFQALEPSTLIYLTDFPYSMELDTGVNPIEDYKKWPIPVSNISNRDLNLPRLSEWR